MTLPLSLITFCEKLAGAVSNAGRVSGWRVQMFGSRGFNADVIVGRDILKVTTGGRPGPDGAGAVIRLSRPGAFERNLNVRVDGAGNLELCDEGGVPIGLNRFVELVGEGCGHPIKVERDLPQPLAKLCSDLATAVVAGGRDTGWRVQTFGARGWNADVILGITILKVTTEDKGTPDGSGALVRLKRPGFERVLSTRMNAAGALELIDEAGMTISLERLNELIAEGCGAPPPAAGDLPTPLNRFCEKLASTIVTAGQGNGWRVTRFGARGFNADLTWGPNWAKIATEGKAASDGSSATVAVRGANFEKTMTTRVGRSGEIELVDPNGQLVRADRVIAMLAEALTAPLAQKAEPLAAFTRLYERLASTVASAGDQNGWRITVFGSKSYCADVTGGRTNLKLVTEGKPTADGFGGVMKIKRPGAERVFTTRMGQNSEIELVDESGNELTMTRLAALLKEMNAS